MTDDNPDIFEDNIDLMVGGKLILMPSYPEYANDPELIAAISKIKDAIKNKELNYTPSPHRYARTNRISTASFVVPAAEKKPETIAQVKYTLDWLEIRKKCLDLYKEIYGKEGYSGIVFFDPNICRIEAVACKGERRLPAGKDHCITLMGFEKQRSMEEIICSDPEEAKMYISFCSWLLRKS